MLDMEAIKNFSIDKSDWQKVKFGDVVFEPKESVKDPVAEGIKHVVGLEHIDTEDIHLHRSASIEESTTFTKRFSPGDVLFGRRRAYLKKAAKADFEGICSGDITVMRVNKELLLPDLLPFIVNNEKFFDYAITHSAGGLSPRVKFKDLAKYELLLPSKQLQEDVLNLLFSINNHVENLINIKRKTQEVFETIRSTIFTPQFKERKECVYGNKGCEDLPLNKYMSEKTLNGLYKSKKYQGSGIRIIHMGELFSLPVITNQEMSLLELTDSEKAQFILLEGDLIFSRTSLVVEGAGKCSIIGKHDSPMTFESNMIRVRLDSAQISPKYAFHFFNSSEGRRRIRRIVGFTAAAAIASSDLIKVKIPRVDLEDQFRIITLLERFEGSIEKIQNSISVAECLRKILVNKAL